MEQNLVSDEELIERINKVLKDSNPERKQQVVEAEDRPEEPSTDKFHDVYETTEQATEDGKPAENKTPRAHKNLAIENHYLSLQLQAEKKKSRELQSKFELFENSVKYFERLNGQLETIRRAVDDENLETENEALQKYGLEEMQKIRPKTIHTASSGIFGAANVDDVPKEMAHYKELLNKDPSNKKKVKDDKEEVAFRDAEDFKQLDQGLEIVKDKNLTDDDLEAEKVFITKTEKRCLEDIGSIAARTRVPMDDKHQKFFERDRRKFANSIMMPEIQEVEKAESVPPEIISKTKETPLNITSTELDGLRTYLLQLKELIARRETAWARTTERDYNQRVEITRLKSEVSHLRMLCEKRQKDVKEREQIIAAKDEEIRELQKRVQGLRNAIVKLEKKDDRLMDTIDGMTNEVLENSQIVQRSYNAMKRQSFMSRANANTSLSTNWPKQPANMTQPGSRSKEMVPKKTKFLNEKNYPKKVKASESTSNDEEVRTYEKPEKKQKPSSKSKAHHKGDILHKTKETFNRADEKLQKVEDLLQSEVLKGSKKPLAQAKTVKNHGDVKNLIKAHVQGDFSLKKATPSNSTMRQEMLTAMSGLSGTGNLGMRGGAFADPKKSQATAAVIANALLAARNANIFNCRYSQS